MPETANIIPDDQLKVEVWPPRTMGGQHVGTQSGIRVTHLPTGIEAVVDVGRSQHTNRTLAMEMILAAITHPKFRS